MTENRKLLALLVEDMVDLATLLRRELEHAGWEVDWVTNLASAIDRAKTIPYAEIILLDLNLPDARPDQTADAIDELQKYSQVVVLSGYGNPELIAKVEAKGAIFHPKHTLGESFLVRIVKGLSIFQSDRLRSVRENVLLLRQFLAEHA